MKILQTIPEFGSLSGGTSTCTYDLISTMNCAGYHVDLLTLQSKNPGDRLMGQGENWIKVFPNDAITPYKYSQNIQNALLKGAYDLYHTNGLWLYCNHETCLVARKKKKPYLITPHGMLYPDAVKRSYWKKWPLLQLFFHTDIANADCFHATCRQEMEHIRNFGYAGPIAIIPNPTVSPDFLDEIAQQKAAIMSQKRVNRFGFLGRLHPVKKIENLLYAIAALPDKHDCELVIMGKGDPDYEQFLRNEVTRLRLMNVTFRGFVFGREKYEELVQLSGLFVPSDFENFGMIVTEALSVGTPVMASLGTPWEDLNIYKCGWWVDRDPDNIAHVMEQIMYMPTEQLLEMGFRGRHLVMEKFAASQVARQMYELYEWLGANASKPKFVYE